MSVMGILSNGLLNYYAQNQTQQLGGASSNNLWAIPTDFKNLQRMIPEGSTASAQSSSSNISQAFSKLSSDLQAGNLSAAQSDFAALQQLLPGIASSAQSQGNIATAFNKLSSDLQSGNLAAAQQDYATLQQDMNNAHGHHHMHSGGANASTTMSQVFSQLGQAIEAGNLSAAQQAYATLQQDFQQYATNSGALASQASAGSLSVTA